MTGSLESLDLILSVIIDDEPACESPHENTECSDHVTHLWRDCGKRILVCANAAAYCRAYMDRAFARGSRCADCHRPSDSCWKLTPV